MPIDIPNLKEWVNMTEERRLKIQKTWNVYRGEGLVIAKKVLEKFKREYAKIPEVKISKQIGVYHGGTWTIGVQYPFIFDRRKIPQRYLGIEVRGSVLPEDMPDEFKLKAADKEYIWAPERFEAFVDRHADEIRKKLGNPHMSRDEMLDAICFGDFKTHVIQCKKWKKSGMLL